MAAELLTQASGQVMVDLVALLFARIGDLPQNPMSPTTAHNLAHSPRLQINPDAVFAAGVRTRAPGRGLGLPARIALHGMQADPGSMYV